MLTYLGREHPTLGDGGVYPECGFVGYNLAHPEIQNFISDWEKLYNTGEVFNILEWHDGSEDKQSDFVLRSASGSRVAIPGTEYIVKRRVLGVVK